MDLSIVVPCYNESLNLATLADGFQQAIGNKPGVEVLLVDNGSTDDTAVQLQNICENPLYAFIRPVTVTRNQGYGFGILSGLAAARGEYLAWTHADLQTDPRDVMVGWQKLLASCDPKRSILRGVRAGRPMVDVAFTHAMGTFASLALGTTLFDINAQPKIFHRSFLEQLGAAPFDFALDLYVLYLAKRLGYQSIVLPVHFGKRTAGVAKGGGSLRGKWKLCKRTLGYILQLRRELIVSGETTVGFQPNHFISSEHQKQNAA